MVRDERLPYPLDRLGRRHGGEHGFAVQDRQLPHGRHDSLRAMVNRRPRLRIVAPNASPEEAAAVVAALERFMRDTVPPPAPTPAE